MFFESGVIFLNQLKSLRCDCLAADQIFSGGIFLNGIRFLLVGPRFPKSCQTISVSGEIFQSWLWRDKGNQTESFLLNRAYSFSEFGQSFMGGIKIS